MSQFAEVVLVAPEIPQNTGNIGRICINFGLRLHLVEPLGFSLEEKQLRRAGLDYWPKLAPQIHANWDGFLEACRPEDVVLITTQGENLVYDFAFRPGQFLVFGNETSGLPVEVHERHPQNTVKIPMPGVGARSFNLANAVAIVVSEAHRQSLY